MDGHSRLNYTTKLLNDGIQYLIHNSRFSLSQYPEVLNEEHLVDIIEIMKTSKYKLDDYLALQSDVCKYVIDGCLYTHDDNEIIVTLPKITTGKLCRMLTNSKLVQDTRHLLACLYFSQEKVGIDAVVLEAAVAAYDYYLALNDNYLFEYTKSIYNNKLCSRHKLLWSHDDCKKYLGL